MCKFTESEKSERKALKWLEDKIPTLNIIRLSEIGSYESWDALITRGRQIEMVEVKIRDLSHDDYPTAYLELDKVNKMIEESKEFPSIDVTYYAFYKEDFILLIFDLLSSHSIEKNVPMPKTTSGDTEIILKDVCAYPIENATIIKLKQL